MALAGHGWQAFLPAVRQLDTLEVFRKKNPELLL
jgi:hypothetical protein